jgi:predicted acyltransferase
MRNITIGLIAALLASTVSIAYQLPILRAMWKVEYILYAALGLWLLALGCILFYTQNKYGSWQKYITELALVGVCVFPICFATMLTINGLGRVVEEVSFVFVREQAFYSAPFGMLKTDKARPTLYQLWLLDQEAEPVKFSYSNGPLYPNTSGGEEVLLPMRKGVLGSDWVVF